ncbi:RNA polymerase sigma factor [Streptomyces sp. NPDC088253]|uniref:RNA polymerase sigma factor n=1 Tax=Streptomyces sp. NPDC088253 TaxID=3365846 RepID=UPI00382399CA
MNLHTVTAARFRHLDGNGPRPNNFEEFYTLYFSSLVAQAREFADNRELAADAVQDALIDVYRRWDDIENPAAYAGVAVRRTIWTYHQGRHPAPLATLTPDAMPLARDSSGRVIDYVTLVTYLKDLPDMQRTVTTLHYFEGWKISDIAKRLQIADSTARAHLVHARRRLKELLEPQPSPHPSTERNPPQGSDGPPPEAGCPQAASATTVERAQSGDSEAFASLYDTHADTVYRYLYLRVGRKDTAEELTAQTFLRALRNIKRFTWQQRDFSAWLMSIARALVASDLADSRFRLQVTADDMFEACGTQNPVTPGAGRHAELLSALVQLSAPQQECLTLRFFACLSVNETARVMGKTDGAVKTLQHRALRRLSRTMPKSADRPPNVVTGGATTETSPGAAPPVTTPGAESDLSRVLHDVSAHCSEATQPTVHAHRRMRAKAGV